MATNEAFIKNPPEAVVGPLRGGGKNGSSGFQAGVEGPTR